MKHKRPIVWGIGVLLAALAGLTVAGSPAPQADTVVSPNQVGPLTLF